MSKILLININHCDFHNPNERLNSPTSLEACYRLGIEINDLYYKDFHKFKLDNLEICSLPKDSQVLRWQHIENRRNQYIKALKNERENIIEGNLKQMSNMISKV